ncbi:hypothetical protein BDP81DRAFT_287113, partial [Colletotrichum phormii]
SNPEENEGPTVLAATITVTCVALIVVAARLWVRLGMIHSFGFDVSLHNLGGFMTSAMAIAVAGQGVLIVQVLHGVGRHVGDKEFVNDYPIAMKMAFSSQPLFLAAICLVKLATIIFQCTDVRAFWDFNVKATYWDVDTIKGLSYANSSMNILTGLLFGIAIPAPMLWSLNVPRRVRISLMMVLGLGVFACAAACAKVYYIVTSYGRAFDPTWNSRDIQMWTVIEANVGIIAGSLPTLRPLFKDFLGSIYGKGSKASTGGAYYGRGTLRSGSNWQTLSN